MTGKTQPKTTIAIINDIQSHDYANPENQSWLNREWVPLETYQRDKEKVAKITAEALSSAFYVRIQKLERAITDYDRTQKNLIARNVKLEAENKKLKQHNTQLTEAIARVKRLRGVLSAPETPETEK